MDERMYLNGEHVGDRLLRSQKLYPGSPYLLGQDPPTPTQISAVLHALADHTLLMHVGSEEVLSLGDYWDHLGPGWRAASALGKFFQRMGDYLEDG